MAIAIFDKSKYFQAKEVAGDDEAKLVEEYKKLSPRGWAEGTNEEVESPTKFIGLFDKKKAKKKAKKGRPKKK